jgi:hypothetical protein
MFLPCSCHALAMFLPCSLPCSCHALSFPTRVFILARC